MGKKTSKDANAKKGYDCEIQVWQPEQVMIQKSVKGM